MSEHAGNDPSHHRQSEDTSNGKGGYNIVIHILEFSVGKNAYRSVGGRNFHLPVAGAKPDRALRGIVVALRELPSTEILPSRVEASIVRLALGAIASRTEPSLVCSVALPLTLRAAGLDASVVRRRRERADHDVLQRNVPIHRVQR